MLNLNIPTILGISVFEAAIILVFSLLLGSPWTYVIPPIFVILDNVVISLLPEYLDKKSFRWMLKYRFPVGKYSADLSYRTVFRRKPSDQDKLHEGSKIVELLFAHEDGKLICRMKSNESTSLSHLLSRENSNDRHIYYFWYDNDPNNGITNNTLKHEGAFVVEVEKKSHSIVRCIYCNDKPGTGTFSNIKIIEE